MCDYGRIIDLVCNGNSALSPQASADYFVLKFDPK